MKELDSFTVERLEEIIAEEGYSAMRTPKNDEVRALAAIALAAKRAEPVSLESAIEKFKAYNIGFPVEKLKADFVISWCLTNLTPQLNSQVPLGSWINCSDQMPEDDQVVAIVDAGHGCFYGGAVVSRSGPNFHLIGGLSAENYDGGAVVELDMEATHWMPLLAAPEKENG
ncbi:DUF551 domain-containing protein [Yersinia intermedia]|uniref:DUF551 domain-containing protein n=1 Tax=Yersinia intermedia TaxID=631 RepID=A0A209A625_YERIN|nr:DUF551 domain-containing protein [Yersinia intermedia]OVZ87943.1 hypothetical protein CBW57_06725 [Yersinia intermedia]